MLASLIDSINILEYLKPDEFLDKKILYGTAGFRMKANYLDWIIFRMGMLAAMRSVYKKEAVIGCMITASHNPEEDNGVKLIDPRGDMLEEHWEIFATRLVNSNDLKSTLKEIFIDELKLADADVSKARVACAHDTRPSCGALVDAFESGVKALGALYTNYGLLSTPQLHYIVRCLNTNGAYGQPTEQGYFEKISKAFLNIWTRLNPQATNKELYVDGANGVGAIKLNLLSEHLGDSFILRLFNDNSLPGDKLNHLCGADFVKVQQKAPSNTPQDCTIVCSVDGDADRVVFFYEKNGIFSLLDGDKISTLLASYLKELVQNAQLSLNLGIVQTAYANGSSTNFIEKVLGLNAACVPTGVKYLHHKAEEYDIGVYFEANGHGTVLFSETAEEKIETSYNTIFNNVCIENLDSKLSSDVRAKAIFDLKNFKDCINQTVGDAISDILAVELVLASKQLSPEDWNKLYTDLPNRQLKVSVRDRNYIQTTDAERRVSKPSELQDAIDKLLSEVKRSFVRPSGTEDVVRVYAEAPTQDDADNLANDTAKLVYDIAGGIGNRP